MSSQPQKARQRIAEPQPTPPILIGASGPLESGGQGTRWGLMLVWFMRIVALLWFALGLFYWLWILEPGPGAAGSAFLALPLARQGSIVFFAVLDFVAAIGLWLSTPWGGVVWLFTALTEIVLASVLPELSLGHATALGVNGALIVVYFLLNIFAAREQQAA